MGQGHVDFSFGWRTLRVWVIKYHQSWERHAKSCFRPRTHTKEVNTFLRYGGLQIALNPKSSSQIHMSPPFHWSSMIIKCPSLQYDLYIDSFILLIRKLYLTHNWSFLGICLKNVLEYGYYHLVNIIIATWPFKFSDHFDQSIWIMRASKNTGNTKFQSLKQCSRKKLSITV